MRTYEFTFFSNIQYIVENGTTVGIVFDRGKTYERSLMVGDQVEVRGDCHGYICPGVRRNGFGVIEEINRDGTDHWFGVRTEHGEFGFCKAARLTKI